MFLYQKTEQVGEFWQSEVWPGDELYKQDLLDGVIVCLRFEASSFQQAFYDVSIGDIVWTAVPLV